MKAYAKEMDTKYQTVQTACRENCQDAAVYDNIIADVNLRMAEMKPHMDAAKTLERSLKVKMDKIEKDDKAPKTLKTNTE